MMAEDGVEDGRAGLVLMKKIRVLRMMKMKLLIEMSVVLVPVVHVLVLVVLMVLVVMVEMVQVCRRVARYEPPGRPPLLQCTRMHQRHHC